MTPLGKGTPPYDGGFLAQSASLQIFRVTGYYRPAIRYSSDTVLWNRNSYLLRVNRSDTISVVQRVG